MIKKSWQLVNKRHYALWGHHFAIYLCITLKHDGKLKQKIFSITLIKLCILVSTGNPLHTVFSYQRSSHSNRFCSLPCSTERFKTYFASSAIGPFNTNGKGEPSECFQLIFKNYLCLFIFVCVFVPNLLYVFQAVVFQCFFFNLVCNSGVIFK